MPKFPPRAKQAKTARRTKPPKPRPRATSKAPPFVIVPKKGAPGEMLLDPERMEVPQTTINVEHARLFHGRASAHKFLKRNPKLKRIFNYQRVA
jgi:hypothetical protein